MGEDRAKENILKLAMAVALQYGHSAITFNHLLAAIIQSNPQEMESILGPKIKLSTLLAMLDADMRDTSRHSQDLPPGGRIHFGTETALSIRRATIAAEGSTSGEQQFATELLRTMLLHDRVGKEERSTTLDYVRLVISPPAAGGPSVTFGKNPNNHGGGNNFGWQVPYIALGMF